MSVLLAALLLSAQGPKPLADLPFEHSRGRIWLKATLNGQPVDATLDSGAAGIYAFEPAAARANGTKGAQSTIFGAGETPAQVWQAQGLRLGLGEAIVPVSHILAPAFEETPRRPIEVIAGFNLLMRYAVDVDYNAARVKLYPSWTYRPPQGYIALRATFTGRNAVVDADLGLPGLGHRRVKALLDTGSGFGIEISRKMALREGLDDRFNDRPVEKGPGGLSGGTRVRHLDRAAFRLAGVDLKPEVRVSMTEGGASGANAEYDVLIGDDVLRHYDLVFHYWRGRVYLRPNGR
ncbi:hypothetical protein EON82_12840 [bacterium]|nr:MAG: hypothetical protein EON82_12840 [bacterium]